MSAMRAAAMELLQYKHLLFMLTWRDIRVRYKQSVMGFLWALLMPLLIVTSGVLVRKAFSLASGNPLQLIDIVSVSVKALPWAFFVGAIRFSTVSLTSNSNLVTKIYFPREVFPLSAVLAFLFDFCVAVPVVALLLIVAGVEASVHLLWIPGLLFLLVTLTAAVGMLLACANLFFRDVKYIVEAVLTYGIFFTPVFYDASMLGSWEPLILMNPVAPILEALNDVVVLHKSPDPVWLTYAACWAVFGFLVSWRIFDRAEYAFAESI